MRTRSSFRATILLLAACMILASCAPAAPQQPEATQPAKENPTNVPQPSIPKPTGQPVNSQQPALLQSKLERVSQPKVDPQDISDLAKGNNSFAVNLYQQLRGQDGNLFFSPYSISEALAMVYAGARGKTEQEMAQTLSYTLPQDNLHPAFNSLDQQLKQGDNKAQTSDQNFQLNIANSVWGQAGFPFLPGYLDILALNYGAGLRTTDFQNAPEPSRQAINQWVSQETKDKIKDILPSGSIQPSTRLVLANAIYFKAAWFNQFDEKATSKKPFTLLDGSKQDVDMMALDGKKFNYLKEDTFQAVELPYSDGNTAMLVLLPDSGKFDQVEAALNADQLDQVMKTMSSTTVNLSMPKFQTEAEVNLTEKLPAMGMSSAFNADQADFSGMDGRKDLYISDVFHKAYINVDENGTEAAAATVAVVGLTAIQAPQEPVILTIDRPFIYMIYNRTTHTILFLGRVTNPK